MEVQSTSFDDSESFLGKRLSQAINGLVHNEHLTMKNPLYSFVHENYQKKLLKPKESTQVSKFKLFSGSRCELFCNLSMRGFD